VSFIREIKAKNGRVYLAEVESQRVNGKVTQRHLRYIGKQADGRTILSASISEVEVEQVKRCGPLLVLHDLAMAIGLPDLLGTYSSELLSLVYAHCLEYKSVNPMSARLERTDLNMLLHLDGLTEARLLKALDALAAQDTDILQRNIFESVRQRYPLKDSGVIYAVTDTYLYGKKCPLGKLGKDQEGVQGRPLIQIGLGVTLDAGIPLFHKVFDGNIHDSKTFQDMVTSFRSDGLRSGLVIYDRGLTSGRNLSDVKAWEWDTLCGVAFNQALKARWRPVLQGKHLVQFENRVRLNETIFYVMPRPDAIDGVRGTLLLCFNERARHDLQESRYDELTHAQALLKDHKAIKAGLEKYLDKNGELLEIPLREAEEFDGSSLIFSTRRLPNDQMVRLYFDKDLVEKAFHSLKGIANLRPVRHWLYNRVLAHVFICYLAYLLLSLLKYRLKKIHMSPQAALRELDTMYKVYLRDSKKGFKISRVVTLTKKQETILKAINKKLLKCSV
jgi:transposase